MNNQSTSDIFAAVAVAVLLILTAWGNAVAMLVASALGLVVGVFLFRKNITRGGLLAAMVGCVLAMVIAVILLWR